MKNKILIGVISAIVIIALIGVIVFSIQGQKNNENVLVLGMDDSYPPMGFRNENNELVGFDIDLATEVCNKLGMTLEVQTISWAAKEQELDSGNIDCIWNGFGYTEERNEAMTLSDVYVKDKSIFFVKNDSEYSSQEDLKGKKIGVQSGSVQERRLSEDEFGNEIGEMVAYTDYLTALMDLEAGNIDAVYMGAISGNYVVKTQNKNFKTFESVGIGEDGKGMVIAFKKGNTELKDKVEKAIAELKEEGKVKEIAEKWFGEDLTV